MEYKREAEETKAGQNCKERLKAIKRENT